MNTAGNLVLVAEPVSQLHTVIVLAAKPDIGFGQTNETLPRRTDPVASATSMVIRNERPAAIHFAAAIAHKRALSPGHPDSTEMQK